MSDDNEQVPREERAPTTADEGRFEGEVTEDLPMDAVTDGWRIVQMQFVRKDGQTEVVKVPMRVGEIKRMGLWPSVEERVLDAATGGCREARVESVEQGTRTMKSPRSAGTHAQARAMGVLEGLSNVVPTRINTEELGDAFEAINAMARDQRSAWAIYLKVSTTFFWVGVHTALHHVERLLRRAWGGA